MKLFSLMAASAVTALISAPAIAAPIYATGVDWTDNGTIVQPDRKNPNNALGAADGKFLSLGLNGHADFSFGQSFTGPGTAYEITIGRGSYLETADVALGRDGAFSFLQSIDNQTGGPISFSFSGVFDTLRLTDTSSTPSVDGFDVDSISVSPVPLPATALLLGGAFMGLGATRRRKSRA